MDNICTPVEVSELCLCEGKPVNSFAIIVTWIPHSFAVGVRVGSRFVNELVKCDCFCTISKDAFLLT